jgi:NH3-dependent NAD+ synthetase
VTTLSWSVLDIDYAAEADRIAQRLRDITARELHKRGLVVAISGGIDSSASIALSVRALGPERVAAQSRTRETEAAHAHRNRLGSVPAGAHRHVAVDSR